MKKFTISTLTLLALVGLCWAQGDPLAQRRLDSIRDGKPNADQIKDLRVEKTATVGGAMTVGGTLTVTGTFSPSSGVAASGLTGNIAKGRMTNGIAGAISDSAAALPAAQLTGNIVAARMTNLWDDTIQTGTCTNGGAISFTPAFSTVPILNCTFVGPTTSHLYIGSVSASGFTVQTDVAVTNRIHWIAVQVP